MWIEGRSDGCEHFIEAPTCSIFNSMRNDKISYIKVTFLN